MDTSGSIGRVALVTSRQTGASFTLSLSLLAAVSGTFIQVLLARRK